MIRDACLALLVLGSPSAAPHRQVAVAAAANLKTVAQDLKDGFEAEHPGVELLFTFGASGAFFSQIQNGAPFDLFLSADREYPARLVAEKLASATDEHVYAFGRLVAWTPPEAKVDLDGRGLAALADPGVTKIAIANPAVAPFGRATEAAFRAAGVYDAVKGKLVLGTSVGQAAQFATTGAATVAFLPYSLTFAKEFAAGKVYFVPERLYPKIEQSGIVLASAREPDLARAFLAFIASDKGRAILERYGYGLP
ncbi:MAG TPA: molybdate ABC transporter substrate-binding protein [Anaeromyxobacteraceae bacterium]|nr:molybdate ABC transporter substrate-binding protein [Anaeromyxobacteraceae bacterium]